MALAVGQRFNPSVDFDRFGQRQNFHVPLVFAVFEGNRKAVKRLIADGANVSSGGYYRGQYYGPLHIATALGFADICKDLVKAGAASDLKRQNRLSPLSLAVRDTPSHRNILDYFLGTGACEVNSCDEDGDTPLHFAACHGCEYAVKELLKHCANPNARNRLSVTPLWDACKTGNSAIVQLLVQHGAELGHSEQSDWGYLQDSFPRSPLYEVLGLTPVSPQAETIVYFLIHSGYDLNRERSWILSRNFPYSLPSGGNEITEYLVQEAQTPQTLQMQCRTRIKLSLRSYPHGVEDLELPKHIKGYLAHRR